MADIDEKDIQDLKAAMAILTREELEFFALDRAVRCNELGKYLTPETELRFRKDLGKIPTTNEDCEGMNNAMQIVKSQINLG